MGVTIDSNTVMTLSMGYVDTGLTYKKMHGTKNKTTTVKWEPQVERAFRLPSEL